MSEQIVSLANLGEGAVIEAFDTELQRVLQNIVDPNTDAKQAREITLKVKIKPDSERSIGMVSIVATSKLAPAKPVESTILIGSAGKLVTATERVINQNSLFEVSK